MKMLALPAEDYARLKAAADADGVSPAQWIANLLIKEGHLPPGYRVEPDPELEPWPQDDPPDTSAPEHESPA